MKKHFLYYVSLIALLGIAVLLVATFQQQKQQQMTVVVMLGIIYVGWGVAHHKMHHSLRARIVLEYVAVALLGIATILLILKSVL